MSLNKNLEDRIRYFFDNVNIADEDIERAKKAIFSKGVEKHIIILEKLKAWNESEKVDYSLVASTYRYDKRIRNVLFKFISYLEEYYRSIILDYFRFDWSDIKLDNQLKKKLEKHNDMNAALEQILFSSLVNQIQLIKDNIENRFIFTDSKHLKENIDALIELRNAVMHNRLLVLYRGFKECYLSDDEFSKNTTLKDNVINLIRFLPEEIRNACEQEINNCAIERNNENKTAWKIPNFIAINLTNC